MRAISGRPLILVVLSALLQVLCFPLAGPMTVWGPALSWMALTPLLVAVLQADREGRPLRLLAAGFLGYLCGIGWYLGNCSWIYQTMYLYGGMAKPVAFAILVLFSLYLGLYHALFAWLLATFRRSSLGIVGALWLAPFAWVAVELARSRITGFPWDLLGNSQIDNSVLTRLAPIGGVMAMSFVVAGVNACFCCAAVSGKRSGWAVGVGALLVAIGLQAGGRLRPRSEWPAPETAVMVQENIAVGATARGIRPLSQAEEMRAFTALSLDAQKVGDENTTGAAYQVGTTGQKPRIILWPEAPSQLQSNDPMVQSGLAALARAADAPVVVGMLGVDFDRSAARGYYLYDSAALFDRTGAYKGRYDKVHLVPWGEYVPYKELFAFASKLTAGAGDMDPGHARTVFRLDGHAYGIFVCYESIFGDEVRQFVKEGANVLVNISDDGWYGDTGAPWQHLNMARMRAIENHRWVLRSTNTGETTAIDPQGNYTMTKRHVRASYALPFDFEQGTTFYTRHGDWLAYVCALVTVAGLSFSWMRRMN
jgi:apolipoprotein N-acyltransferase